MRLRLPRPKSSVRWRLTLLYGGLFLVCGAALLTITYALVAHAPVSSGSAGVQWLVTPASSLHVNRAGPVPPPIKRILTSPRGRAVARFVVNQQRIADLHQLEIESAIALAIMAIVSGLLGWVVAGRVLRPLHSALDAQRRFVANASHELRTPLTAVRALLEMGLSDPHATVESFRQTSRHALEESEQQEQLIDALLALAKGQRGLDRRASVDLAQIADEVLQAAGPEAAALELELDVDLEPTWISGDRRLVARLVSNLVHNAIQHNRPGGHVSVWVKTRGDRPAVMVANSGPPVPAGEIERLLQPFQRLGDERVGQGVGLGLSIVAAIAEAHGAALEIRPLEQGGLTVAVRFPAPAPGPGPRRRRLAPRAAS